MSEQPLKPFYSNPPMGEVAVPDHIRKAEEMAKNLIEYNQPWEIVEILAIIREEAKKYWQDKCEKAYIESQKIQELAKPIFELK